MSNLDETKGKRKGIDNLRPELRKQFTSEYQPSPEAKSKGWEEHRKERLLTKTIFKHMSEGTNLDDYIKALIHHAKIDGNAKAIDTLNRGIEDQIDKSEVKHEGLNIKQITFE
jgi:hypothetical protein